MFLLFEPYLHHLSLDSALRVFRSANPAKRPLVVGAPWAVRTTFNDFPLQTVDPLQSAHPIGEWHSALACSAEMLTLGGHLTVRTTTQVNSPLKISFSHGLPQFPPNVAARVTHNGATTLSFRVASVKEKTQILMVFHTKSLVGTLLVRGGRDVDSAALRRRRGA